MKTVKYIVIAFIGILSMLVTGCNRIEPGYAGIKVNQAGSSKGVEEYPVKTGWVFYNPMTEKIYEYPTFQQNVIWTHDRVEGSPHNEEISFNCKGGAAITADVSMSGKFKIEKIPFVFVKFRAEPNAITHGYLRNEVRDCLQRVAATYDPMDIIGEKRGEFLDLVKTEVDKRTGEWWVVDYITFANKLRMDPRIEESINTIIAQKQQTAASELKVKQKNAEADQKVAEAEGEARSKKAIADGEAQSILVKAKAQAEANRVLAESLTPVLVQYTTVEKWNGQLSQFSGASPIPFINIGSTNK
jgi:regulator of protease activity HflC (stomatin/prohibitin superfamily)